MGSHKWLRAVCASTLATVGVAGASVPAAAQDDVAQPHVTYVACDAPAGGDGTQAHPFRDIKDLDGKAVFGPGKQVLFKRGCSFAGNIAVDASGAEGSPTVVGAYGTGERPILDGQGSPENQRAVIEVQDKSYVTVQDLRVKGGYFNNVYVHAQKGKTVKGITVQRLEIEENNWKGGAQNDGFKVDNFWVMGVGGVIVMPCSASAHIEDVLIDQVVASKQHYAGVQVGYHQLYPWEDFANKKQPVRDGYMIPGCFDAESPKYPLVSPVDGVRNAVISNSKLFDNDAMGVGIFGATNVLLRNNDLYGNGSGPVGKSPKPGMNTMNGTGAWWDTTENVTAEWNNAYKNKVGWTGHDGTGLDADRNTKNSIIRYNYLHDNAGYGASVIAAYGDASTSIHSNVIANNGADTDVMVSTYSSKKEDGTSVTGRVNGLWIFGNTIYRGDGKGGASGIKLQTAYAPNAPVAIANNIIRRADGGTAFAYANGNSAKNVTVREQNLINSGAQQGDISGEPTFLSTALTDQWPTAAMRLSPQSPGAQDAAAYTAKLLPGIPPANIAALRDFWGKAIPAAGGFAVGADALIADDLTPLMKPVMAKIDAQKGEVGKPIAPIVIPIANRSGAAFNTVETTGLPAGLHARLDGDKVVISGTPKGTIAGPVGVSVYYTFPGAINPRMESAAPGQIETSFALDVKPAVADGPTAAPSQAAVVAPAAGGGVSTPENGAAAITGRVLDQAAGPLADRSLEQPTRALSRTGGAVAGLAGAMGGLALLGTGMLYASRGRRNGNSR
ncbi:right-handed parallel beta-helix repeat-containing protein [Trueperella pyogenes]